MIKIVCYNIRKTLQNVYIQRQRKIDLFNYIIHVIVISTFCTKNVEKFFRQLLHFSHKKRYFQIMIYPWNLYKRLINVPCLTVAARTTISSVEAARVAWALISQTLTRKENLQFYGSVLKEKGTDFRITVSCVIEVSYSINIFSYIKRKIRGAASAAAPTPLEASRWLSRGNYERAKKLLKPQARDRWENAPKLHVRLSSLLISVPCAYVTRSMSLTREIFDKTMLSGSIFSLPRKVVFLACVCTATRDDPGRALGHRYASAALLCVSLYPGYYVFVHYIEL